MLHYFFRTDSFENCVVEVVNRGDDADARLRRRGAAGWIDSSAGARRHPEAARRFMQTTFGFITTDKPHVVAAAFVLKREQIIPGMFRALLKELKIGALEAPAFHYYLERHIHLDEDHHGPLTLRMLNELCAGDPVKLDEAKQAAVSAITARIEFWDGVLAALDGNSRACVNA